MKEIKVMGSKYKLDLKSIVLKAEQIFDALKIEAKTILANIKKKFTKNDWPILEKILPYIYVFLILKYIRDKNLQDEKWIKSKIEKIIKNISEEEMLTKIKKYLNHFINNNILGTIGDDLFWIPKTSQFKWKLQNRLDLNNYRIFFHIIKDKDKKKKPITIELVKFWDKNRDAK